MYTYDTLYLLFMFKGQQGQSPSTKPHPVRISQKNTHSQSNHWSSRPHKIIDLIGQSRLLSSMNQLLPISRQAHRPSKLQDRFIPNRKQLSHNYDKQEQFCMLDQNYEENDPQNISITEIYNSSILGAHNQATEEELLPFRNSNILRYNEQTHKPGGQFTYRFGELHGGYVHKVRKVSKMPCKVLDAPALQDDFYLNLIDWSCRNELAVGLGNCIYLWNAETSKVTKLCELNADVVTSVGWANNSKYLAIGCNRGEVQLWDVDEVKQVRRLGGHQSRVGAVAWNSNILATGSRDKSIYLRDIRHRRDFTTKMIEHSQEVCGLKWSHDEQYLASGGNDNKICIWSVGGQAINRFSDHHAAVKALAWSPQQHGLLASGGGTADRTLRLRNVFTGDILCQKDTGSQICNLAFSRSVHQVVSTHGYSQNQINLWSYPKLKRVATLVGHSHRVLFLAMSPDGSTIVTGAGDETLRFWNIFPKQGSSFQKVILPHETMQLR